MKLFPWSGFLYELRRALLSVPLLVLTALIILVAFAILGTIAESTPPPSTLPEESGAYYFTGGAYHFEFYAFTQSGASISGATFTIDMYPANATPFSPGASLANATGVTGSNGLVNLAIPLTGSNYSAELQWTAPGMSGFPGGPGPLFPVSAPLPGVTVPFASSWTSTIQTVHHLISANALLIYYPGPNGTVPPDYQVYWSASVNESFPPTTLSEASMHRLGALTNPYAVFPLVVPRNSNSRVFPNFEYLQVELFTTTGQLVATDTNQTASNFFPPAGGVAGTGIALSFGGSIMVFLVPLMAILASYSVYGRDRLTGVLEGVLARPVSRLGLVTSRYLAVVTALCLAATISVACLDGLIAWVYGGFLPVIAALVLFTALLVEIGAFTGITFLLSHALRSAAGLVGISLGLFALLTIGWLIIPNIIGGLNGTIFTAAYERALLQLEFLNPVQFLDLTTALYFNSVGVFSEFGLTTVPSAYGVTLASVIATGIAWAFLPLLALLYVVRIHD
jgi:ABC-type transport system involved in multi-copper enzyme maturation permease subunit